MTEPPRRWRLLVHEPADGAWNMAVDEAVLESYLREGASRPPTLRLYAWSPPALSLGKSQKPADVPDARNLRRTGIDLVRRPTGGGAVLHDRERTYSVVGPLGVPPFDGGVLEIYRRIAAALELGLRRLGLEAEAVEPERRGSGRRDRARACFGATSAHEITLDGRKLVGSAQLRRGRAFLQHGSIPFELDARRLATVLGDPVDARAFTDLGRALGRPVDLTELDRALSEGFAASFGVVLEAAALTPEEELRATRLRCWKHLSATWTLQGRSGEREARISPAR